MSRRIFQEQILWMISSELIFSDLTFISFSFIFVETVYNGSFLYYAENVNVMEVIVNSTLVVSVPGRRAFSAFWPRVNWSESKKIDEAGGGGTLHSYHHHPQLRRCFCSRSNFCSARMRKKLFGRELLLRRLCRHSRKRVQFFRSEINFIG